VFDLQIGTGAALLCGGSLCELGEGGPSVWRFCVSWVKAKGSMRSDRSHTN
jgi:hypothetical protein